MNYAHFKTWIQERVEELVSFGVPRTEAESLMHALEHEAVTAELRQRSERQFLIDFKRVGAQVMAERMGVSRQTVWRKRSRLLQNSGAPRNPAFDVESVGS